MAEVYLKITTWILVVLAVVMVFGNGIIVLTVAKNHSLRQKQCLYLITALAVSNFITGIGTLPYSANMIIHDYINCTRGSIIISTVVNICGVRMAQFITLFISFDRLYAVLYPVEYRTKNHIRIAKYVAAFGLLMSCIDIAFYLIETNLAAVIPACNLLLAIGPKSEAYRFITDLILNVGTQIVYAFVFLKIRKLRNEQSHDMSRDQFRQANHTISMLLFCSLLFLTFPSVVNMYNYIYWYYIFESSGPIISIFICINGGMNIFLYHWTHKDFNKAIKALFGMRKNVVQPKPELPIPP